MPGSVLMTLEGVIAGSVAAEGTFASRQPHTDGLLLFHGLRGLYRVVLSTNEPNEALVRHWLKLQGITDEHVTMLLCRHYVDQDRDEGALRKEHLRQIKALGWSPSFYIDASPANVAWAFSQGITGLLFAHPEYRRSEFKPDADHTVREWSVIEDEITRERELARTDPRRS